MEDFMKIITDPAVLKILDYGLVAPIVIYLVYVIKNMNLAIINKINEDIKSTEASILNMNVAIINKINEDIKLTEASIVKLSDALSNVLTKFERYISQ